MAQQPQTKKPYAISDSDQLYIEKFRLMDDDFMRLVFDGDTEATAELLRVVLERKDILVDRVEVQKEIKSASYKGRTIRLDIAARDSAGKLYDIEIQRSDAGASEKRARYHSSAMDSKILKAGQGFDALPETFVIFITEHDIYKANQPIYHIDRQIKELSAAFQDEAHILFVNGEYKNDADPVGRLMHDFRCSNPDEMFSSVLADKVRYFKRSEGGRAAMSKMMEELRSEYEEKGIIKGQAELVLRYMAKHSCDAEKAMDELDVKTTERVVIRPLLA